MNDMDLTPEEMRKLRTSKGLSQQEVADKIGVSQRSYSMYERGEMIPKHSKMVKLLEVLEVITGNSDDNCHLCTVKDRLIDDLKTIVAQKDDLLKSKEELIQSQKETISDLRAIIEHYRGMSERGSKKAG